MKAVILAGGLGTRLLPLTKKTPKPMLPLGKKPILEHLIEWNKRNGIREIVLCTSYLAKTIKDYFKDGHKFNVNIEYAVADKPLATAGQLKTAQRFIDDTFVCMYGDSIFGFSLRNMLKQHKAKKAFITMGIHEYKTRLNYGVISTGRTGKVTKWEEKPEIKAKINMGCYIMEPGVFDLIPKNRPYGMDQVVRKAIENKKPVNSFITKKGFSDIGNIESYKKAYEQHVQNQNKLK